MWPGLIALFVLTVSSTSAITIDLSNRHLRKEDFFIKIQSKINLQDVTDLILRQNEFDSFLDCSTNLASLRVLDLSQNHLQRFFFLCKEEYNLQVLNVSHNKLEYIDDNAFNDRIPKLKMLDLSWNKLSIVNETMLEYFKILEYLSLSYNPIGDGIHENAFWTLTALKHLDLRNLSAPFFSSQLFKTLTNLSTLDLSYNPIRVVPVLPHNLQELDLSGTHITQIQDFSLPNLKELKLNYMPYMKSLCLNDFENETSLDTLSVVGSKQLVHVKLSPRKGPLLRKLQRLYLHDCGIQTLGEELQFFILRVAVLTIDNNPWKCDCEMEWLNGFNSSKEISREMKCYSPEQHHDKLLSEIPNYDLECEYVSTVLYPALWSCIIILIVILLVATGLYLVRRPFSHWDIRRRNRDTVTYTNVVESSNDLVRILAVGENIERTEE